MNNLKLYICVLLCFVCLSCRKHDYHTVVIHVPEMHNKACAELVSKAVYFEVGRCKALNGDNSIRIDMHTRTVAVSYNSLNMALKNIEFAIAAVGFSTDNVPADQEAAKKLPAECRSVEGAPLAPVGIDSKPLIENK